MKPASLDLESKRFVGCPLCGNTAYSVARTYEGRSPLFRGRQVVTCVLCGLSRMDPMPSASEIERYYREGLFWDHVGSKTPNDIPTYHHQALARTAFLEEHSLNSKAQILDIGAGFGILEQKLAERYPQARLFAVEPDPKAQVALRSQGIEVRSELEDYRSQTFDVIILSHVLEHISDPITYLKQLRSYCHPETRLFIELPNEDHLYKGYLEPHVLFFNPTTLTRVLSEGGFHIATIRTCGTLRSEQKRRNEKIAVREKVWAAIPFKSLLRELKRSLSKPSQGPAPDPYECAIYGEDRIWIRCLAVPS